MDGGFYMEVDVFVLLFTRNEEGRRGREGEEERRGGKKRKRSDRGWLRTQGEKEAGGDKLYVP